VTSERASHREEALAEWREVGGRFGELCRAVPADRWDAPAPVAGWVARDVVRHLVEWLPPFLAGGAGVQIAPGPAVDDDPVGAWQRFADQVEAVLADPASEELVLRNPHIGEVPLPRAVSQFFTADVFQHTWDLARAAGQDDTLDPERCARMLEGMQPLDELLRASGQYGPRVPVPDDADVQSRLLGFIGRDPSWRPPAVPTLNP
jgi:uncharacterized protein (TIGR03086 family)